MALGMEWVNREHIIWHLAWNGLTESIYGTWHGMG